MQDWRAQYLGLTTFPATLTGAELDELFMLGNEIARTAGARRTPLTRLGLVLQIGFLRLTGRLLNSVQVIPPTVLARAGQADISAPQFASIRSIYRRRMTLYQHQQAAVAAMGFKDYGDAAERASTGHLRCIATRALTTRRSRARQWPGCLRTINPGITGTTIGRCSSGHNRDAFDALVSNRSDRIPGHPPNLDYGQVR